ncbi:MAG: hypothetical protein ACJ746_05175 [Bryobacteraceae bacterium]
MLMEPLSAGTLVRGNLIYLPVVPGRIEFALRVRHFLIENRPEVVAVQLQRPLEALYRKAMDRMPQWSVAVIHSDEEEESAQYLPIEPGDAFTEALRTASEIGAETIFLEHAVRAASQSPARYPDTASIDYIGFQRFLDEYRVATSGRSEAGEADANGMAWKLQGAVPFVSVCVIVSINSLDPLLDAMDVPQEEPAKPRTRLFDNAELFNLHPDCLAEISAEPPFYQEIYERARQDLTAFVSDRRIWQSALLKDAEREYEINTGEKMRSWQRLAVARFSRNLAALDGDLLPGTYDLTLAARSIVDDNYAYEVWQTANRFSVQQTEDESLETVNISGEEMWLRTRKLRIRRRLPRVKQMFRPAGLKKRKHEQHEGEWASQTDGRSICSYPPEDLVIENFGLLLKGFANRTISEERSHTERFTTSMLDGLDLRETVRNWHEGVLFVRETVKLSGEIGAVVIIFEEDREDKYTYLTTWLGEHQNESDMAFYSTPPFDHIVGPGIGRAEYGGLLMTLPPRRMYNVWDDPDYDLAETKAERLLMAALDYSIHKDVLYVAKKPPRSMFRQLAARFNRKIRYIPIGQLSPTQLKKVRVVHVLDSYERRSTAKQYIW